MKVETEFKQYGGGWYGIKPDKRFCAACNQKITLAHSGPLWFAGNPLVVYHFQCALDVLKSPGLDAVRSKT